MSTKQISFLSLCAAFAVALLGASSHPDIVIDDFEGETFAPWKVEGTAFGERPTGIMAHPDQRGVGRVHGNTFANSFSNKRATDKGKLISPEFTIQRRYLNALTAGGKNRDLSLILNVEGEPPRQATGPGEQYFRWVEFDLEGLEGKKAFLEIVDASERFWIGVDYIVQTDDSFVLSNPARTRRMNLSENFLIFPIKKNGIMAVLKIDGANGEVFDVAKIRLAPPGDKPDYWTYLDVSQWKGREAVLEISDMDRGKDPLSLITASDKPLPHDADLYQESYRPRYHFTAARGWNNDVNGMFYLAGTWHLYYQSNPFGANGDLKNWGHAESTDLVHWRQLPQALYSYVQAKDRCYSGSAVVDLKNTSGFGKDGKPPVIAMFTDTGCGEAIAYSNDDGASFTYYSGNPVVKHKGRDPRAFWYQDPADKTKGHWVMVTFDHVAPKTSFAFYTSPDMKDWTLQSESEPFYECPDLYPLAVDGDKADTRWVLVEANSQYVIGAFDGKAFTQKTPKLRNFAGAYYASQSFTNAPDGRVVQMGWLMSGIENAPIIHGVSLPTEMTLRTTPEGVRLFAEPVKELEQLRGQPQNLSARPLPDREDISIKTGTNAFEADIEIDLGDAKIVSIRAGSFRVDYNTRDKKLFGQPYEAQGGKIRFRLFADVSMGEVFVDGGRFCVARGIKPPFDFDSFELKAEGGTARLLKGTVWPMATIWDAAAKQSVDTPLRELQRQRGLTPAPLKD